MSLPIWPLIVLVVAIGAIVWLLRRRPFEPPWTTVCIVIAVIVAIAVVWPMIDGLHIPLNADLD